MAELLPWIAGIVLILAAIRALPRRRSRRRRYAQRRTPRSGASRPRERRFPRESLPGRVMRVVDGDSIEAEVSGLGRLLIRLANVDAPEHDQPWGREAGEALARLVRGGRPEFRLLYRDQYARVVGLVSVKGIVVNEQLVRDGHAWAYDLPGLVQPPRHRTFELPQDLHRAFRFMAAIVGTAEAAVPGPARRRALVLRARTGTVADPSDARTRTGDRFARRSEFRARSRSRSGRRVVR